MRNSANARSYCFRCDACCFAFLILICSSSARYLHAEKIVDSLKIEVRGRVYVMQCDEEIISLVSTDLNGDDRRIQAVQHPESLKSKVIECRISPWRSNTGIAAVIKERLEGKNRFTSIVMPKKKDGCIDASHTFSGLIYETEHEWKILSLDGIQTGDSMMVILGETDESPGYTKVGGEIIFNSFLKRGVIRFDGCPIPPTMSGVSHFGDQ